MRIALVVGGIDRQHPRLDALQPRFGIVIARGIELIDGVVGVAAGRVRQHAVHRLVGLRMGAGARLPAQVPPLVAAENMALAYFRDGGWLV